MCFAPLICKQPAMLNSELVGTEHCLGFLLFITSYKARNTQTSTKNKTAGRWQTSIPRIQSKYTLSRPTYPTLWTLMCIFQASVIAVGIIFVSCIAASIVISESGTYHAHIPQRQRLSRSQLGVLCGISSNTWIGTALCNEKVYF